MGAVVLVLEIAWVLGALLTLDAWFTEVDEADLWAADEAVALTREGER